MLTNSGYIYAAREEGTPLVKIGFTCNRPEYRLYGLRSEFHVPISLCAAVWIDYVVIRMERAVHRALAASRIEREWFYLHMDQPTLETIIRTLLPDVLAQAAKEAKTTLESRRRDAHWYWINPRIELLAAAVA